MIKHKRSDHLISKKTTCWPIIAAVAALAALVLLSNIVVSLEPQQQPTTPRDRLAAARLRAAASQRHLSAAANNQPHLPPSPPPTPVRLASQGSAVEVKPPTQPLSSGTRSSPVNIPLAAAIQHQQQHPQNNRSVRTADVFQGNGDGFNLFVTNTCEREFMRINIRTSRPFNGIIHTKNERNKSVCRIEGNGETDYNLDISHVLNDKDPNYCGAIKARKQSPADKDMISVVIAVRFHNIIELPDDKFFLLNCTNRCRKPDCSSPSNRQDGSTGDDLTFVDQPSGRLRDSDTIGDETGEREFVNGNNNTNQTDPKQDECTVWRFPWLITLLWCMAIMILALLISHCIICSSLVCKCVKTEVEEQEPSIYEGASDYDDDRLYNKRHPYRIDYDNRDIYKTSNNYEPYSLEDAQKKSSSRNDRKRDRKSANR